MIHPIISGPCHTRRKGFQLPACLILAKRKFLAQVHVQHFLVGANLAWWTVTDFLAVMKDNYAVAEAHDYFHDVLHHKYGYSLLVDEPYQGNGFVAFFRS